ncbi:MAG: glycosyltransferase family 2 protein [Planctomycetes bacterium]|nr:glycosyltransferase family 2 protein [Planctomycetota bacterium]
MSEQLTSRELKLFSVVIPARDEAGSIEETLRHMHEEFSRAGIPHELVVVDDGSTDETHAVLDRLGEEIPVIRSLRNTGENGFGRAVVYGLDRAKGDAITIMMADSSDSPADAVKYWEKLKDGYDCVFGSRFIRGGKTVDYPLMKLILNRMANGFIRLLFRHGLNDTTNAFKAYTAETIMGCRPLLSPHFNLTVELPLKCFARGYRFAIVPITWTNRKSGASKLRIKEMGSRYFFICMYLWLEKYFSRGDYRRKPG